MTWNELATQWPEFVQWAAQRHGPLPDGDITEDTYTRLVAEWTAHQIAATGEFVVNVE